MKRTLLLINILMLAFLSIVTAQSVSNGLQFEINDDSITVTGYTGRARTLIIPAQIQGLPVRAIGEKAFSNSNLTSITIPLSVSSIGYRVFEECKRLTEIIVDDGNPAYAAIDGVLFDKNMRTLILYPIGKRGNSYVIPSSVTAIGDIAFHLVTLTSVTIPSSVISIGPWAFTNTGLKNLTIPPSVTTVGAGAFYGTGLIEVTIPPSITSIAGFTFAKTSLKSIAIPPSVISVDGYAFYETPLTNVTISRRTQVGELAFPPGTNIIYSD